MLEGDEAKSRLGCRQIMVLRCAFHLHGHLKHDDMRHHEPASARLLVLNPSIVISQGIRNCNVTEYK